MDRRRCAACGRMFRCRAQAPRQRYCTAPACQRERRRRWQHEKRCSDPDYRDNQAQAQRHWCERHPEYWREYREQHPDYVAGNRARQRERDRRRRAAGACPVLAKMDASAVDAPFASGTYRLTPVLGAGLAKMDAWTVEIALLSGAYALPRDACKERTR